MAHVKNHDFHILSPSVYPFLGSVGAFAMLFGSVLWMHGGTPFLFWGGLVAVLYTMFGWWSEVVKESHVGDHRRKVEACIQVSDIYIPFVTSLVRIVIE